MACVGLVGWEGVFQEHAAERTAEGEGEQERLLVGEPSRAAVCMCVQGVHKDGSQATWAACGRH